MEMNKILTKVTELAEAITTSELYDEYKQCQHTLLNDEHFINVLNNFQKEKENYEEVTKYGKYHPDLERVKKTYQQAKIELMSNETFKRYKRVERELDTIIFNVEKQLKEVVGIKDKHSKSSLKFLY